MNIKERVSPREWIAWGGLALSLFAILENRAMLSDGSRPTLSRVLRMYARRSTNRRRKITVVYIVLCAWLGYHVLYQELAEDGTSKRGIASLYKRLGSHDG